MYGPPVAIGFEKVLADLVLADYALLGKMGELNGHFTAIPYIGTTYNSMGQRADRVVTKVVQNVSGGSLAAGTVCVRDSASGTYSHGITATGTANIQIQKLAGILIGDTEFNNVFSAPTAIADDSICDIMLVGIYRIRCVTGISAGDLLGTSATAGLAAATTTADASFGRALTGSTDDGAGGYYLIGSVSFLER